MSPRTLLWMVLFVFLAALGLRLHGASSRDSLSRELLAYQELRQVITQHYVEPVEPEELCLGALQGMTRQLDEHSAFLSPKQYQDSKDATSGHFFGIGVLIQRDEKRHCFTVTPLPGSPALAAGLLAGDRIVKVEDKSTYSMDLEEASSLIRGPEGTPITLAIGREGRTEPLTFRITRADIKEESVVEALVLTPPQAAGGRVPAQAPKCGYIQLAKFQKDTAADVDKALTALEGQGIEVLVLDLRLNHGGLLDAAVAVCDLFLSDGVIVTVKGREDAGGPEREEVFQAKAAGTHKPLPLAVLIDSESASAAEIVAGCLHDRGRAVLVGEKSYGKGSVQTIFPLELGAWGEGAVKLTTARYFTPSGAVIHGHGIEPDYPVPFTLEQTQQWLMQRHERRMKQLGAPVENAPRGNLPPVPPAPKEPFYDLQLEKALEVLTQQIRKKAEKN